MATHELLEERAQTHRRFVVLQRGLLLNSDPIHGRSVHAVSRGAIGMLVCDRHFLELLDQVLDYSLSLVAVQMVDVFATLFLD